MPQHVHSTDYLSNPHDFLPNVVLHPDVQIAPVMDVERYLLPAVFELKQGEKFTVKYPGPGVCYISEGGMIVGDAKDPLKVSNLLAGSILHIEEGEVLHWHTETAGKGFCVFWVPVSIKSFETFIVPE